ncbi:FAD-dependent oxidoreductase [Bacillaceae bacterium Marseille-Q3522]|nr:FAD-dependent oxidoreductase [Bacillaceae bacterium Marseille-Q3522]
MSDSSYTMPQFPESYWRQETFNDFEKLSQDLTVDVAIVGGGITGITAGYLLSQKGVKTAILEAGKILNGTTGHTTAKITSQHGLIYDELIQHFGEEKAKLYYFSTDDALRFIQKTAANKNIKCDLTEEDAYIYAVTDKYVSKIEKEAEAYQKLGIPGDLVSTIPFDIPITAALQMKKQAQFHPLKYLKALIGDYLQAGGVIFEQTTAMDIVEDAAPQVITQNGYKVSCQYIICATHFPFHDKKGFYFARMYPERSYVIAIKAKKNYPGGMYISVDEPTRSLRSSPFGDEQLILVGGERHKTGQGPDTLLHYQALEAFAETTFGIKEYLYRWSAQDLTTLDKIPYIGAVTANSPTILVATGYRKWGMTNGTAAAMLLADIILDNDNPYKELFTPSRFQPDPSLKEFVSINTNVAGQLLKGKLGFVRKTADDLEKDEGAAVIFNGKRAGAYKDLEGKLHIVDTTCTHLGCECEWNHGDRTWDCPCHGSRYSIDGAVIEGPTEKPLKRLK